jgi:DNA-binding Lrp family transcriptional regulator
MSATRTNDYRQTVTNHDLDRTDVGILSVLQNNARLSVKGIAAEVGLAPSSTHERIRRMRDSGILRGTHVEVDPKALGIGLEALFMIELAKHKRSTVDKFMDDIVNVPEVRSAFLVTGRYDLIVHVVVRDTHHLKDLALDRFTNRPGVTRIETSIIFDARRRYELPVFRDLNHAVSGPTGARRARSGGSDPAQVTSPRKVRKISAPLGQKS